jgi:hypothetical protein
MRDPQEKIGWSAETLFFVGAVTYLAAPLGVTMDFCGFGNGFTAQLSSATVLLIATGGATLAG